MCVDSVTTEEARERVGKVQEESNKRGTFWGVYVCIKNLKTVSSVSFYRFEGLGELRVEVS